MSHKTKAQKLRQRSSCRCWYPKSSDLVLPDVPAGERAEVRKILSWLDGKFPVCAGNCWMTAQAVVLMAKDSRVQYVEGVSWNVKQIEPGRYVPLFQHDSECASEVCV